MERVSSWQCLSAGSKAMAACLRSAKKFTKFYFSRKFGKFLPKSQVQCDFEVSWAFSKYAAVSLPTYLCPIMGASRHFWARMLQPWLPRCLSAPCGPRCCSPGCFVDELTRHALSGPCEHWASACLSLRVAAMFAPFSVSALGCRCLPVIAISRRSLRFRWTFSSELGQAHFAQCRFWSRLSLHAGIVRPLDRALKLGSASRRGSA